MNDYNNYPTPQGVENEDSTQITRNDEPARNTSHPIGIAAAVVGSMLAGGGVAYAISKMWPEGQEPQDQQDQDLNPEEGQEQIATVVEDHVVVEHRPAPPKGEPAPPHEPQVEFLGTHVETIDGEDYVVGEMKIDGETVFMVDTDHDGVFDTAGCDADHNNVIDRNEVVQLPPSGPNAISIAQFQVASGEPVTDLLAENEDPKNEDPDDSGIELLGIHETYDEDGNPITIAGVRVEGVEVAMIDVDNDGVFDLVARDIDGDGYISEGEIAMLHEPITVGDVAELPHADDYTDDLEGDILVDDSGIDDSYDDGLVAVSEDLDDDEVEVEAEDEEAEDEVESEDSAMDDEIPAEDSYEAPDEPMADDDFGMMGDEGINC